MNNTHQKLVRDCIPDIIRASGKECEIEIMADHEYQQALREKVLEEAQEVAEASPDDLINELADLYEVIDALIIAYQLDKAKILAAQERRRQERGGFSKHIRLLKVWVSGNGE